MQIQKKVTRKEDGRFLIYYHFPETATPEETQVFEEVQSIDNQANGLGESTQTLNTQSPTPNTGGASHV